MRRRRLLLVVACIPLGVAVTSAGLWLYALRAGVVNRINYERVRAGMPREGVEQLFGRPGQVAGLREWRGEIVVEREPWKPPEALLRKFHFYSHLSPGVSFQVERQEGMTVGYWSEQPPPDDEYEVYYVLFDRNGRVVAKKDTCLPKLTWLERLRTAIGR